MTNLDNAIWLISIVVSILIVTLWFERILILDAKWRDILKNRFLDWYWQRKKKAAIHRIDVNRFKLERLSDIEEEPTPEILGLVNRITEDVEFVKSYDIPEESSVPAVDPISEEDITLATLILNKIDEMIILETQNILLPIVATGNGIDVRNYGDYVKEVAAATQRGLNRGVYVTTTVFTSEYINSYIIKKSSVMVLNTMTTLNADFPPVTKL